MTIRERFQGFQRRATYFAVIVSVLMAVFINLRYPDSTPLQDLMAFSGMGVVLAAVFLLVFKGRFKCPRCGADFRQLRRAQLGRFTTDTRMYWELWDACPKCGVSFDAPYSTNADR